MAENLRETDLGKIFYSESDAELNETTEDLEDATTVEDDEELDSDESGTEEESGTTGEGLEITAERLEEMQLAFDNRKHQQADYSKKTQAAANQMKLATAEFEKFQGLNNTLQGSVDAMELLLNEEENAVDWDELSEDDPGQALKLERKFKAKRKELELASTKVTKAKQLAESAKLAEEGNKLLGLIPDWYTSEGKVSKVQKSDMVEINKYFDDKGYPANYQNTVSTALEWQAIRDAAKYHAFQKKKGDVKAKLVKAKTVTEKTKAAGSDRSASTVNKLFYG